MPMWNPWRGCRKRSEGCRYCCIHKSDARRGVATSQVSVPSGAPCRNQLHAKASVRKPSTDFPTDISAIRGAAIPASPHFFAAACQTVPTNRAQSAIMVFRGFFRPGNNVPRGSVFPISPAPVRLLSRAGEAEKKQKTFKKEYILWDLSKRHWARLAA